MGYRLYAGMTDMKTTLTMCALLATLAGCTDAQTGTVAGPCGVMWQNRAPNIPFYAPDGRQTSLDDVRLDVTIVAFVAVPASECFTPNPRLKSLAQDVRYVNLPVSVVQISSPDTPLPTSGPASTPPTKIDCKYMVILADPNGYAWKAFGDPKPGDLFLMDWNNQIVERATLDKPGYLPVRAEELGKDIAAFRGWNATKVFDSGRGR